jgi:hypothetical protein
LSTDQTGKTPAPKIVQNLKKTSKAVFFVIVQLSLAVPSDKLTGQFYKLFIGESLQKGGSSENFIIIRANGVFKKSRNFLMEIPAFVFCL